MNWQSLRNKIIIKRTYEQRYGWGQHPWSWLRVVSDWWNGR